MVGDLVAGDCVGPAVDARMCPNRRIDSSLRKLSCGDHCCLYLILDAKSRRNRLRPRVKQTDIRVRAENESHGWQPQS
eukprot:gene11879-biopygen22925